MPVANAFAAVPFERLQKMREVAVELMHRASGCDADVTL
jgi:hypothetical protein